MDTRFSRTAALLLVGLAACSATETHPDQQPKGSPIEDANLSAASKQELKQLEALFKVAHVNYAARRTVALASEPRLGPWLAKAVVGYVVGDYDRLKSHGPVPQLARIPRFANRTFFRGRRELVVLGDPGRQAIVGYLMRSRRGELRQLSRYLLKAHQAEVTLALMRVELAAGVPASQRTALQVLADLGKHDAAFKLLEQTTRVANWQLRGTATRVLATAMRKRRTGMAGARLWRVFESDDDEFVRRQALLGLGDLADADQVRPLVESLAALMKSDRLAEAKAAGEALRLLTGRSYGTKVRRWREWLGNPARRNGGR